MNYLGIDPGLTGALVLIKSDPFEIIKVIDMPVTGGAVDPYVLNIEIQALKYNTDVTILEDVHSMPKQGVASTFNFGRTKGVIEGVLAANDMRITYVSPQKWKRAMGLIKAPKYSQMKMATQLFGTAEHWKLKKHKDRAEAALMAAWFANK